MIEQNSTHPGPACCVNVTNHPVTSWPQAQVEAAERLGFGPAVDLAPPLSEVPATASLRDVEELADEVVARVLGQGAAAAVVAGEPTLSFAIVRGLQARGVRCVVATTARDAVEVAKPDGTITTTRVFRFAGFRDYPRLSVG